MKNKYDRLPHAGDIEREAGTETVYLSPKPVPTGVLPFSARQLHRNTNETFLDFAVGQGNFEFMARIGIGAIMLIVTLLFFSLLLPLTLEETLSHFGVAGSAFFSTLYFG